MWEPASILPIKFVLEAAGCRMARQEGALTHKAPVLALLCHNTDIVGRGAAFCAGVLYNAQAGTQAECRVTLVQFHKTASGAEEATPLLSQGVVAKAGPYTRKARATMNMRPKTLSLVTKAATAEAPPTARVRGKADAKAFTEGYTDASVVEAEGSLGGAAGYRHPNRYGVVDWQRSDMKHGKATRYGHGCTRL